MVLIVLDFALSDLVLTRCGFDLLVHHAAQLAREVKEPKWLVACHDGGVRARRRTVEGKTACGEPSSG
jgi:hypothetical protein